MKKTRGNSPVVAVGNVAVKPENSIGIDDFEKFGRNIMGKIEDGILYLAIDLAEELGPSSSGKNQIIATTGGNIPILGATKIGINCYKPI